MTIQSVINLVEAKDDNAGHRRLVKSIINAVKEQTGKAPTWIAVEIELKAMEKDKEFYDRIKRKAKQLDSDGYYWAAIRKRAITHFTK